MAWPGSGGGRRCRGQLRATHEIAGLATRRIAQSRPRMQVAEFTTQHRPSMLAAVGKLALFEKLYADGVTEAGLG